MSRAEWAWKERRRFYVGIWNGDGKKNSVDNFIEYQVYKDCTNKKSSSGVSSDWWVMPVLAIIAGVCPIVGVIIFLGVLLFD